MYASSSAVALFSLAALVGRSRSVTSLLRCVSEKRFTASPSTGAGGRGPTQALYNVRIRPPWMPAGRVNTSRNSFSMARAPSPRARPRTEFTRAAASRTSLERLLSSRNAVKSNRDQAAHRARWLERVRRSRKRCGGAPAPPTRERMRSRYTRTAGARTDACRDDCALKIVATFRAAERTTSGGRSLVPGRRRAGAATRLPCLREELFRVGLEVGRLRQGGRSLERADGVLPRRLLGRRDPALDLDARAGVRRGVGRRGAKLRVQCLDARRVEMALRRAEVARIPGADTTFEYPLRPFVRQCAVEARDRLLRAHSQLVVGRESLCRHEVRPGLGEAVVCRRFDTGVELGVCGVLVRPLRDHVQGLVAGLAVPRQRPARLRDRTRLARASGPGEGDRIR